MTLLVPKRACPTCPYVRATPPGVWHPDEYRRLADFDDDAEVERAIGIFHCHQENATKVATVCLGWLRVHPDCIGVRLAQIMGELDPDDVELEPDPRYYSSGREAMEAGLAGIEAPSPEAQRKALRLLRRGAAQLDDPRG